MAIDEQFIQRVQNAKLPAAHTQADVPAQQDFLELFQSQLTSRHLDLQARQLKQQNRAFYTIASSGHEGNAAIARALTINDMAFLHYRSGAFMLERARQAVDSDPIRDHLLALMGAEADPIASGRHKVFGSVALNVPPQTSTIASHLPKAVGAALSIARAKELKLETPLADDSIILCSFGDASLNHSSAQGALNSAEWIAHGHYPLPIIFLCEDNGTGISVPTPADWVETTIKQRPYLQYIQADGLHLGSIYQAAQEAIHIARSRHQPVFLHMRCVRLLGHAGSDIESTYWSAEKIADNEFNDPLLHSARLAIEAGYLTAHDILTLYETIRQKVQHSLDNLGEPAQLNSAEAVMKSIIPPQANKQLPKPVTVASDNGRPRTMAQNINLALLDLLSQYDNAVIFGEDVAAKGGVYHVTADLMQRFGQRRVFDTLLDEQTILGTAIGMAQNGFLPVPEIQFLAYLHNAEDQLRGEAATLSFFSNGQFTNPMVIRIPGLAYQKGFGGHFHNDNSIAVLRDIPGLIVACPSNGADAAKLLRTCFQLAYQQQRVVVFLEPIALYMVKELHHYPDVSETIPYGQVTRHGSKTAKHVIVSYANGVYLSLQAQKQLAEQGIDVAIIDCHWLVPLPAEALLKELTDCENILIVDECRQSGSLSEGLMTLLLEQLTPLPTIKRIVGKDSFIPLGNSWQYVLPSVEDIVTALSSRGKTSPLSRGLTAGSRKLK